MNLISMAEVPADQAFEPLGKPDSLSDGLLIAFPVVIAIIPYAMKEIIQFHIKRKTARYETEIEIQKMEQQEKSDRIEYLEKQNEMLLAQILSLRRMMEMSGPLSLKMYKPSGE